MITTYVIIDELLKVIIIDNRSYDKILTIEFQINSWDLKKSTRVEYS